MTNQPQSNFQNNQKYKIDIDKIYASLIEQIDNIRSNVSTANNPTLKQFLKSSNSTSPSTQSILSQVHTDINNVQESRCHAFYRLIGLPVFEPGGTFYSPGLNQESNKKSYFLQYKKNVASNISDNLYNLMDAREINFNNYLQIFYGGDINASVLALSITQSPIRNFNVIQNISADIFNAVITEQSYTFNNTLNYSGNADFKNYQDSNGNVPSGKTLGYLSKRSHIVAPFMVDPRVELSVNPPYIGTAGSNTNTAICKIVGAPFASNKSQLQYVENIYAVRPIIETICRQRLNISQPTSTLSARFQDVLDYVKNGLQSQIADAALINKAFGNPTKAREDQVFLQYINIIESMIDKLANALHIISDAEMEYHWVPIPNKKGPEFGSTTQGLIIGDENNSNKDQTILEAIINGEIDQIKAQNVKPSTGLQTDTGNFTDLQIAPSPDTDTNDTVVDKSQKALDDMISDRNIKTTAANDALRTLEIILGEFSGFGLCDIIAVYLALWVIDTNYLVSMLDNESFVRLAKIKELQSEAVQSRINNNNLPIYDITTVMKDFEQRIADIYALMDKLLLDRLLSTGSAGNISSSAAK